MFDKILLPTDGSEVSLAAADRAIAMAKLTGAGLHAVFIQEPYPYAGVGATNSAGRDEYLSAAHRQSAAAFAHLENLARGTGITLTTEHTEGSNPAQDIVDAARRCNADVIVMGSHGRRGVARVMLGSVAAKVLLLADVPVMIIK